MLYYTCFYRHRDKSGKIVYYTLRNEQTLQYMQVTPEQLKYALLNNTVSVFNLKLTSDNRIIEAENTELVNSYRNAKMRKNVGVSSRVKIINDDEQCNDYFKDQIRKDVLQEVVKPDGPFEKKTIWNLFSRNRQGSIKVNTDFDPHIKEYSGMSDEQIAAAADAAEYNGYCDCNDCDSDGEFN
jgi:hypothetical protein